MGGVATMITGNQDAVDQLLLREGMGWLHTVVPDAHPGRAMILMRFCGIAVIPLAVVTLYAYERRAEDDPYPGMQTATIVFLANCVFALRLPLHVEYVFMFALFMAFAAPIHR